MLYNRRMNTYGEAVETFLAEAYWLDNTHLPSIVAMQKAAEALDNGDNRVVLISELTKNHRFLLTFAPKAVEEEVVIDPLEQFMLDNARA